MRPTAFVFLPECFRLRHGYGETAEHCTPRFNRREP
jgi:hypothetical protein